MKQDIHPTYHQANVSCVCGNNFTVGSTQTELSVELCAKCHPFYTGKQKLVDTARRVEKYQERATKKSDEAVASKKAKTAKRKAQPEDNKDAA